MMDSYYIDKVCSKVRPSRRQRAQAMVEFALVLPLLLLLLYGIVEFGRLIFMYASLVTASREGARYGAASGELPGTDPVPNYRDCEGIRDAARRSAILMALPDDRIIIRYESVDKVSKEIISLPGECPNVPLTLGDRIVVDVSADFQPIVPLVNLQPYTIHSETRRTILRDIFLGEGGSSGGEYDPPLVYFLAGASTGKEGETVYVDVELNSIGTSNITVPYTVSGTARPGEDLVIFASGEIVIDAGSPRELLRIDLIADGVDEPNETLVLTLGQPTNATLGSPSVHTLTIEDMDGPPVVSFAIAANSVAEAVGIFPVAVTMTGKSGYSIEVYFSVTGGTATGEDYTISTPSPLVIPPMSSGGNIVLLLAQDGLDEDDETLAFKIDSVVNAGLGIPDTHLLTIQDSDPPPNVYFTLNSQTAPEGVTASVVAQLNKITTRTVQVPYTITYKGADAADYILRPVSPSNATYMEIPAGSLEATLKFELIKENPDIVEKDEIIIITLGRPLNDNAVLVTPDEHQLTIGVVEPPTVFFMLKSSERGETTGLTNLVVQLSNAWNQDISVPFDVDPASIAASNVDYRLLTSSPLVIPAGSAYGNIVVEILKDDYDEDNETAVFKLGTPTNATVDKNRDTHTLTIIDENEYPAVQFVQTTSSVSEDQGTIDVLLEMSSPSSKDVLIDFQLGKATTATLGAADDFTYQPVGQLVIPAGETATRIVVTVFDDINNDPRGELDETVVFTLVKSTNANLGANKEHTLTIIEDEMCPVNYSYEAIGSKINVNFEYKDPDSELKLAAIRFDFLDAAFARPLWEIWQNTSDYTTIRIFYQESGALTGSYIKVPDPVAGYYWISTPLIQPYTKLQFKFGTTPLYEGKEITLTLAFDPDCSKVLKITP